MFFEPKRCGELKPKIGQSWVPGGPGLLASPSLDSDWVQELGPGGPGRFSKDGGTWLERRGSILYAGLVETSSKRSCAESSFESLLTARPSGPWLQQQQQQQQQQQEEQEAKPKNKNNNNNVFSTEPCASVLCALRAITALALTTGSKPTSAQF